jgi:hypothetical protein
MVRVPVGGVSQQCATLAECSVTNSGHKRSSVKEGQSGYNRQFVSWPECLPAFDAFPVMHMQDYAGMRNSPCATGECVGVWFRLSYQCKSTV